MKKDYPSIAEAEHLIKEVLEYRRKHFPDKYLGERYIGHITGVAEAARKIAEKIKGMDPERAYVFGYLHDCGKRIPEKEVGRFHGQEGHDLMLEEGYPAVARICLTHSFSDKDFNDSDSPYPQQWKDWARNLLRDIEYDDYDRLIQLCDKFQDDVKLLTLEERAASIARRYNLSTQEQEVLLKTSYVLKNYFDKLCGQDIYEILEIRE